MKCNNNFCQNELYLKTRARRCKRYDGTNYDLLPDFSSIERDAAQFGLNHVEWTDFFGLVWEGKKGVSALAGAPDYKGSLYYYNPDESEFYEAVAQNFYRKYQACYGVRPHTLISLMKVDDGSMKKFVTNYQGNYIIGWFSRFRLCGERKYLDFLYQAGLGEKNAQGFGMFEIL